MTGTVDRTAVYDAYWTALAGGDTTAAVRTVLDAHATGADIPSLLDEVVCAAQAEVGRRWAADEWNVAQEHRATSISEEAVAALAARIDVPASRGRILVACADGEWHSLPSRVLAASLRDAGWDVNYLGASIPVANVAQFLHDAGPDVVALSCMLPTRLLRARGVIEAARGAGVPVLVGGGGFGPDGRWGRQLGADAWAPTARDAVRTLETMPSFTTPAPPLAAPHRTVAALQSGRAEIVAAVTRAMRGGPDIGPDIAPVDGSARPSEIDIGQIVDFLVAAVFVGDVALFADYLGWMAEILDARRVERAALRAAIQHVATAITDVCGERPETRKVIDAGLAVVG